MKSFFITGTDTEVGKTHISCLLLKYIKQFQQTVVGFKPIAAGAEMAFDELVNEDALNLLESGNIAVPYRLINPIVFEEPIAPHIAAQKHQQPISFSVIDHALNELSQFEPDYCLVEGAGGWALPVGKGRFLYEWVNHKQLPVVLVVGMKLGCLNHALLTLAHIKASGGHCIGWIANHVDPDMQMQAENLDSLRELLDVPLLAIAPYSEQKAKLQVYQALNDALQLA